MSLDTYLTTLPDDEPTITCEECGSPLAGCASPGVPTCQCEFCDVCGEYGHVAAACPDVPVCLICEKQAEDLSRSGWCASCIATDRRESEPVGFDLERAYERLGIDGLRADGTDRSAA